MPAAQLFSAGLERAINQLIKLDPESAANLHKLSAKHLEVEIAEFPHALVFACSDQVHVLVREKEAEGYQVDCKISLSLQSLQRLQDSSQITSLIKQGYLELEGDIHVAQAFSQLLKELHIDWEEQLSKFTGDVVAHTVFSAGKSLFEHAKKTANAVALTLKDGAMEEKKLAAHPYVVEDFCRQVNEVRSATERLDARLKLLETQREQN